MQQKQKIPQITKLIQNYELFFTSILFTEIEHIPDQFKTFSQQFKIDQGCLIVPYSTFDKYYQLCLKIIKEANQFSITERLMAAEILLCMNGQNEKAWSFKRNQLNNKSNIQRQLSLNAAICLKFKKSSICYDYRLELIKKYQNKDALKILEDQNRFVNRVLNRFYRNYYCWCYRLRLFKYLNSSVHLKTSQLLFYAQKEFIKIQCEKHIQDYSAYNYYFNLILHNIKIVKLQEEMVWVDGLLKFYQEIYSKEQKTNKLYTLLKFKEWIKKLIISQIMI